MINSLKFSELVYILREQRQNEERNKNSGFDFTFKTSKFHLLFKFHSHNHHLQGRSQNLKEVPQNFTEVFSVDDVQVMTSYGKTNIAKKKKLSSIVISDVKLAS